MGSRRQFLLSLGATAAGAAALAGGGVTLEKNAQATENSAQELKTREAAASADFRTKPQLGTRRVVWSTAPHGPYAAITFDDGPTPDFTPRILAALEHAGVHATFFVMGHNAVTHPGLVHEIVAAGHEIGNHSWSHLDQATIAASRIEKEIVRCKDAVEQLIQRPLIGFRPPRGELTGSAMRVAAELDYDVYMWSTNRGPNTATKPDDVARAIDAAVHPGDIIDLHDGIGRATFHPTGTAARNLGGLRDVEARALPEALRRIADRGIILTSATDLVTRSEAEPLHTWIPPTTAP